MQEVWFSGENRGRAIQLGGLPDTHCRGEELCRLLNQPSPSGMWRNSALLPFAIKQTISNEV